MRPSPRLVSLLLMAGPLALAQNGLQGLPIQLAADSSSSSSAAATSAPQSSTPAASSAATSSQAPASSASQISIPASQTTNAAFPSVVKPGDGIHLSALPTLAGVLPPTPQIPNTAGAAFMQKSHLPDGTVFVCVGAILAFFAMAVLTWRGLVAWSLHRSVARAAMAQHISDMKAVSAVPAKKRGMYNVVGAHSTMSLDHLAAAPIGTSKTPKRGLVPEATGRSASSLFFSPTAGSAANLHNANNRSSTYLPSGYYASGNAAPAQGSPTTHVGGQPNLSASNLAMPGNRFSHRSYTSPPDSPSTPARGSYARAPPSRDGPSMYNRNSSATLGPPRDTSNGVYGHSNLDSASQLSLNVPGGTNAAGGRAPSTYLEDLFENHGSGPIERF
ncbi:hypothetical protein ACEQ8H_000010 [Pleosporales sp. CAS-2024a]